MQAEPQRGREVLIICPWRVQVPFQAVWHSVQRRLSFGYLAQRQQRGSSHVCPQWGGSVMASCQQRFCGYAYSRAEIGSGTTCRQRLFGYGAMPTGSSSFSTHNGAEQFRHRANQKSYLQRGGGHLWLHSGSGGHLRHNMPIGYKSSVLIEGRNKGLLSQGFRGRAGSIGSKDQKVVWVDIVVDSFAFSFLEEALHILLTAGTSE